jgi:AcrR family transcriptional regulator
LDDLQARAVTPARGETYGGQSRQQRAADRRERIVAAAVRLFAVRDYDDVTVADVCTLARVSKRYFYDFFTDREDLLVSVHREHHDWLMAGIGAAAPKHPRDLDHLLRPMMAALVRMLAENPERARVVYINAPRMERRRRGLLRKDAELFGRFVRPAVPRPRDHAYYDRAMLTLVAGVVEIMIDWVSRGMTDPPDALVDHLTALAVSILDDLC